MKNWLRYSRLKAKLNFQKYIKLISTAIYFYHLDPSPIICKQTAGWFYRFSPGHWHRPGQEHLCTAAWSRIHRRSWEPGYRLPWAPDDTLAEERLLVEPNWHRTLERDHRRREEDQYQGNTSCCVSTRRTDFEYRKLCYFHLVQSLISQSATQCKCFYWLFLFETQQYECYFWQNET